MAKKKKKTLKAGDSVVLVIPTAKKGCDVVERTGVKKGSAALLVIPTAKKGCD